MKKACVVLTAALLFVSGVLWAQKRTEIPGKRFGHKTPHVRVQSMHNGGFSLDDFFGSTDVPKSIPDLGSVSSTLTIPGGATITHASVHVVITHTYMRDLTVVLFSPGGGDSVKLIDVLPIDDAVNMDVWFDDGADVSIMNADTPIVGTYRPMTPLAAFDSLSSQGLWTMTVRDTFAYDTGSLVAWGIDVNPAITLQGTVTNASTQAPVRDALVEVVGTAYFEHTNTAGRYQFLRLDSSGTYSIRFTKVIRDTVAWYDTLTVGNVAIQLGSGTQLDTVMTPLPGHAEFLSTAAPVFITDADSAAGSLVVTPVSMPLRITAGGTISDLKVLVNITHTYDQDLIFWLRSPQGDSVLLANRVGTSSDNFTNTLFDDSAALAIIQGTGPFAGAYRPEQPFSAFRDSALAGTWALLVVDSAVGDSGFIHDFTLEVTQSVLSVSPNEHPSLPAEFAFAGNYPNPFNGQTEFRFDLARRGRVDLVLYNTLGQKVAVIEHGTFDSGSHVMSFDARGLASGLYLARFTFNGASFQTRKVLLLR